MEYNTQREKMIIPEYGRNIQKMVDYIKTVDDKEERTRLAKVLIRVMGNLSNKYHEHSDFKNKLWNNLAMMSNYELDIDYPVEVGFPKILKEKPNKVPYMLKESNHRHYGRNIKSFINAVIDLEEGEEREILIETIANHMKKSYLMWNKQSVNDSTIFTDLEKISDGKIIVDKNMKLKETRDILSRTKPKKRVLPRKK